MLSVYQDTGTVPQLMLELLLSVERLQGQKCEAEARELLLKLRLVRVGQHLGMSCDLSSDHQTISFSVNFKS